MHNVEEKSTKEVVGGSIRKVNLVAITLHQSASDWGELNHKVERF